MRDEFTNRMGMFRTVKQTLNLPEHLAVWQFQQPQAFATTFNSFTAALTDLESFVAEHGQNITGSAADKRREEEELETAAHELGSALALWFRGQNDETNAALVARSISAWRGLRDEALLQQSQIVIDAAQTLVSSPQATFAADYGITENVVTGLMDERNDYAALIAAPQQKLAGRKALTSQYRSRFNAVEAFLDTLDSLILQHRRSVPGRALVAAYQSARIIRDLGSGPSPPSVPNP